MLHNSMDSYYTYGLLDDNVFGFSVGNRALSSRTLWNFLGKHWLPSSPNAGSQSLPTLAGPSSQGSSSSSMMRPKPSNDKVILYTISVNKGLGANGLVKKILMSGNVIFEERNPEHLLCPCRLIKLCAMVQKRIRAPTDARETAHHSSYSPSIPKQNSVELGPLTYSFKLREWRQSNRNLCNTT